VGEGMGGLEAGYTGCHLYDLMGSRRSKVYAAEGMDWGRGLKFASSRGCLWNTVAVGSSAYTRHSKGLN
jgi:hypothetical protein